MYYLFFKYIITDILNIVHIVYVFKLYLFLHVYLFLLLLLK